jgi:actin-related protein
MIEDIDGRPWNTFVFDQGTITSKAGIAGEDNPLYIGETNNSIKSGLIVDSEAMLKVYREAIEFCQIDTKTTPALFTESIINTDKRREKTAELVFEDLQFPMLMIRNQNILGLYANGRTTGAVLDSGSDLTTIAFFSNSELRASNHINLGGHDVTRELQLSIANRYWHIDDMKILNNIKVRYSYLCQSSTSSERYDHIKDYELPDGQCISLVTEHALCAEVLFNEYPSFTQLVADEFAKIRDKNDYADFASTFVLNNGNVCINGLASRLSFDVEKRLGGLKLTILDSEYKKEGAWIGASIIGSLSSFKKAFASKQEYDEVGAQIVYSKRPEAEF